MHEPGPRSVSQRPSLGPRAPLAERIVFEVDAEAEPVDLEEIDRLMADLLLAKDSASKPAKRGAHVA
jgi:hypothetical protein